MHASYVNPVLKQLRDQQVRFAPREKKIEQVNRAERLLAEMDRERNYTYEYLCYRITDYRPEATQPVVMDGKDAIHDLRLFVEDVSDAANIPVGDAGEPVHTVEELSKLFKVSTKTIARWREQGLVSRRFVFEGRRKRVGFLRSSVERFMTQNEEKIKRGERFSQLSDVEKTEIIDRARRLASAGGCPSEVARRVAKRMNRSVETIRYTLRNFDQQNPHQAVFPDQTGLLSDEQKQRIYQQAKRGDSIDVLAKRYCRTRTTIYRVLNEVRAKRILELPLEYMHNETFDDPANDKEFLGPTPVPEVPTRKLRSPSGLPPYLAALYEVPLLAREQEAHLFRKFNYLKHKAKKLREALNPAAARTTEMNEIEALYDEAVQVKNEIVQANLRLVVSIAKRHVSGTEDFFSLVSDGNMSLIRAVEKFDYSRGNKFSTYASWAIMKNFARTIPEEYKRRDRFRTSQDELFVGQADSRPDSLGAEVVQNTLETQVQKILSQLDERERQIIISRFGLDHSQEPLTLKEVGEEMGVTKERVRQIESRALTKARQVAMTEHIELPD